MVIVQDLLGLQTQQLLVVLVFDLSIIDCLVEVGGDVS